MPKVIGAGRLLLMAVGTALVTLVAVLVIGPWGWTAGIDVTHGPPLTGPPPQPTVAPDVVYQSADGSIRVTDDTYRRVYGADYTVRFDVTATVRDDHSVEVVEDIAQWFGVARHGIERQIPLSDEASEHALRSLQVSTDAGTPGAVELSEGSGFAGVAVRIGDPDTTVTGLHRYRLAYVLENVVSLPAPTPAREVVQASPGGASTKVTVPAGPAVERVALDAFSEWRQPIYGATYTVTGPQGATAQACFQGPAGATTACASVTPAPDGGRFDAVVPSLPGQSFTVQVDWPAGTFGPTVAHGPERGTWPVRLAAVALSLLGVVVVAVAALARRRQLWSRTRQGVVATFGGTPDAAPSELVPPSPRVAAPLEFVPPVGLRPAELLRVEEGARAEPPRLVAATVIDLAAGGELELVAARDDEDWVARRRRGGAGRELRPYEERLLAALFPEGTDEVRFGDRAEAMGTARDRILEQLDDDLKRAGLLERRLGTVPSGCASRAVGTMAGFVVGIAVLGVGLGMLVRMLPSWALAMLAAGLVIGAVTAVRGLLAVRRAGRDLTARGLGVAYRTQGFRRFFDQSEQMHARAAADAGLLRQYLGYAVAFDAVDRWVAAFDAPDLTWMGAADTAVLTHWVYGSTMARAATPPAPVHSGSGSSGFSGFSGGFGGGGGGGSGGGGGGSW